MKEITQKMIYVLVGIVLTMLIGIPFLVVLIGAGLLLGIVLLLAFTIYLVRMGLSKLLDILLKISCKDHSLYLYIHNEKLDGLDIRDFEAIEKIQEINTEPEKYKELFQQYLKTHPVFRITYSAFCCFDKKVERSEKQDVSCN